MLEPKCFYKFTKFYQILVLTLTKIAQILQKLIVFFLGRGRRDSLDFDIFGYPNGWSFSTLLLIFFDFDYLWGKRAVKVGRKVKTLGPSVHENSNPSNFFQTMFFLLEYYPWWEFWIYWTIFGVSKAPKTSPKWPFHGCWIGTQKL